MYLDILLWLSAIILVCGGLVGLVFPALPGAAVLYAGLFVAAWAEDFAHGGATTLVVLGIMTGLTYVLDFLAGAFGAKRFNGGKTGTTNFSSELWRPNAYR
jgi:uncharacterized protein YqgC (DUF456 family)